MNTPIKIGVLSTASIGKRFVIPAILELPEIFTLSGIAGRNKENTRVFANEIGESVPYFEGYEALIDKEKTDALYIPLPNSLHYEWVKKALEKGIHVLVEKSLGCTLNEVNELTGLAEAKGLALVENFQFRFHPQTEYIVNKIQEGVIGEIRSVKSYFGFPPFSEANNIRYQAGLGGGALLDAGAYPIKALQLILGNDLSVTSSVLNTTPKREVDIWGGAFVQQNNGPAFANISFGFDHFYQCSLEVWGSKGKLTAERIFTAPPGFEAEIKIETASGTDSIKFPRANHFKNMLMHFYGLIKHEKELKTEYLHNLTQARLIEEVRIKSNE
jgi:NDP-hexose-3-ketoreductase